MTTSSTSFQTFYQTPYPPRYIYALIAIHIILFAYLCEAYGVRSLYFFILGNTIGMCILAIVFDPATTYRTTRKLENGKVVPVLRPLVGFQVLRFQLEASEAGEVWYDGYRHEEALFRL